MKIVLASSSPRRKELLQTAGINFEIDVEGVDEGPQGDTPEEKVCSIAAQKCRPVAARRPNDCVIGADTVVSVDGDILGKPHDSVDAAAMLRLLSGRTHSVWSGIAAVWNGHTVTAAEETAVTFSVMAERDIAAYLASGEPFGKAGAYAIQGGAARYITGIRGDYFNVVGLPVHRLVRTLKQSFGILL